MPRKLSRSKEISQRAIILQKVAEIIAPLAEKMQVKAPKGYNIAESAVDYCPVS